MQRLRGSWLALMGASLLVLFSISVAVGADPETDANRGRSISGFVHSLIFGEPGADEEPTPDQSEEDEDADQAEEEEAAPEDEVPVENEATTDEATEANLNAEVTGAEHGACVAEVAQSDAVGGPNENHGGAVSEAARETCWQAQEPAPEETLTDPTVEEFKNHGECVSEVAHSDEVGGPNENHGGAVSQAARETCREAAPEEASTEVTVVDAGAQFGSGGSNGNGHGRGGSNGGGRGHNK